MNEAFDPYYKWLGIRPEDQPPHHYRLLALSLFESDQDVIASAADQRMSHLRGMQTGKHAALSQRLLNEISAAKICLLNSGKKAAYDDQLRAKSEAESQPVAPIEAEQPASASPLDGLLDIEQTGSGASSVRSIRTKKQKLPLPALIAAGALAAAAVGAAAFWQFGASSQPAPNSIAAGSVSTDQAPPAADGNDNTSSVTTPSEKTNANSTPDKPSPLAVVPNRTPAVRPASGAVKEAPAEESAADDDEFWKPGSGTTDKPPAGTAGANRSESVDLLKLIEPARDSISGGWTREDGALVSPAGIFFARLQVPYAPPAAYQLTAVVERAGAGDSFSLGLVIGTSQPAVVLDGWYNKKSGIAMVDGRWGDMNDTTVNTTDLLKGGQHTIVCRVQPDRIEVQVDQRKLIDWRGDSRRLSIDPRTPVRSAQLLYLVTHTASFRFTKLELVPLAVVAGGPVASNPIPPALVPAPGPVNPGPPGTSGFPTRPTGKKPPVLRLPRPDDGQQEKARQLVLDVFQAELAAAKKGDSRTALARKLLMQARNSNDSPAARYVLLTMCGELAAEAGDLELALNAANEVAAGFDVPASEVKLDALVSVAPPKIAVGVRSRAVDLALRVADDCVDVDDYDRAGQAARAAAAIARTAKDAAVAKAAGKRGKEIAALAKSFDDIQPQFGALRQDPSDAAANLAVGKWYCLAKEDWDKGLPLLAAGSDPELKAIAEQEQLNPTSGSAMAKLGDLWWEMSEMQTDANAKKAVAKRATFWYTAAEPRLSGLAKTKVQLRLSAGPRIHKTIQVSSRTCIGNAARELPAAAATGIEVHKGQHVTIHARGKWQISKKAKPVGADRLVVAIGSTDKPALQSVGGNQQEFVAEASGELFLGIRDSTPDGNSGHLDVDVEVK